MVGGKGVYTAPRNKALLWEETQRDRNRCCLCLAAQRNCGSGKSQAQQLTFLHSFSGASAQTVSVMPLTLTFPLYIKPTATAFPCRAPDPLSFLRPKAVRVQSTTPRRPWPSVTPCFLSTISSSLKVLSYQYLMAECPL